MYNITTFAEAKAANQAAGEHFYDDRTKGTFGLRMLEFTVPVRGGAFVLATMRRDRASQRKYAVRFISNETGKVHILDVHQFPASHPAHSNARSLGQTWEHGCQVCRNVGHTIIQPCKE